MQRVYLKVHKNGKELRNNITCDGENIFFLNCNWDSQRNFKKEMFKIALFLAPFFKFENRELVVFYLLFKMQETKNILYEFQSGFRTSYSTDTCLIDLQDSIRNGLDGFTKDFRHSRS